jgi:hypothetical protein
MRLKFAQCDTFLLWDDTSPMANIEAVVGYGSYDKFRKEVPIDVTKEA